MNQSQNENYEQGTGRRAVRVRDYTQSQTPSFGGWLGIGRQEGMQGTQARRPAINFDRVARGLIWASVGLGLLELLMPKQVQRWVGVRRGDHTGLIRMLGLREISSALMIFMQPRPIQGIWSRVAGDAMDLGLLGAAMASPRAKKPLVSRATALIVGITALDVLTATQMKRKRAEEKRASTITAEDLNSRARSGAFHVARSVTINRSAAELYQFWRNFANLPRFMYHLEEVQVFDDRHSHWVTSAPLGTEVSWDAEIIEDQPNQLIAWRSTENADVQNRGLVRFEELPHGRGTVVRVDIEYRPPGGALGRAVAKLFGEEPAQQVKGDLNRFKQVMETGEVVRSEGSPQGLGQKLQRPARPLETPDETKRSKNLLGKILPGKRFSGQEQTDKQSWSPESTRSAGRR